VSPRVVRLSAPALEVIRGAVEAAAIAAPAGPRRQALRRALRALQRDDRDHARPLARVLDTTALQLEQLALMTFGEEIDTHPQGRSAYSHVRRARAALRKLPNYLK
jgi:hypothetical protein